LIPNSGFFLELSIGDMLAQPTLPLDLIDPFIDIMKSLIPSYREFLRVIV